MKRFLILIIIGAAVFVMVSRWGAVTDALSGRMEKRPEKVVSWVASATPDESLRRAKDFMAENPDTFVKLHFRESGSIQDALLVSFLSGNPPDIMRVSLPEMREMIASGMLRPMDDLLERQLTEDPNFVDGSVGGVDSMVYFTASPNDRYIREMDRYPKEAARLLAMHGKFMGFIYASRVFSLSYNKRVFREAAEFFGAAGEADKAAALVDAGGRPTPPKTWSGLLRVAKLITEYGRRGKTGACGIVITGQRSRDLTRRQLEPLAAIAGSRGFNFKGKRWCLGERPVGFFEYEHPAVLAALKLLLQLRADGSALPGTSTRHFEECRASLGKGSAAMLIDGWWAASVAVQRVPLARDDIGSAPLPVPDAEAERILGMKIGRGKAYRISGEFTNCITSGSKAPWAAWRWMTYTRSPAVQQRIGVRGGLPGTWAAAEHLGDPKWYPFGYQPEVWQQIKSNELWPLPPLRSAVLGSSARDIFHAAFFDRHSRSPDALIEAVRPRLAEYSARLNQDLARRVRTGEAMPEAWTFADWDPLHPQKSFTRQRTFAHREDIRAQIDALRAKLPPELQRIEHIFKPSATGWQVLWIPGLIVLTVVALVALELIRSRRRGRPALRDLLGRARVNWVAYVFIAPVVVFLFAFVIYPALYQFYLSAHSGTGIGVLKPEGLGNYVRIFRDGDLWGKVVPNTLMYMAVVTAGVVGLALLLACLLNLPLRAGGIYRVLFFMPMVTSLAAVSVVFIGLLGGPDSGLNQFLEWVGLVEEGRGPDWLGDPATDLWTVIAVSIWHRLPYNIILCLAGLQTIAPQLYDAAKVDGASPWGRFRHVTLPGMAPILLVVVFNSMVTASRAFGPVYILTEGGKNHSSEIISTYIFKWGFTQPEGMSPDIGYASALGVVYSMLLGILIAVNVWVIARRWRRRLAPEAKGGAADGR